jgi:hypothetical protein
MQLGKSQKANQFLEQLKQEGEVIAEDAPVSLPGPLKAAAGPTDPVSISIQEKLSVVIKMDGGVESLEIVGEMALVVQKAEDAHIRVHVYPLPFPSFSFLDNGSCPGPVGCILSGTFYKLAALAHR